MNRQINVIVAVACMCLGCAGSRATSNGGATLSIDEAITLIEEYVENNLDSTDVDVRNARVIESPEAFTMVTPIVRSRKDSVYFDVYRPHVRLRPVRHSIHDDPAGRYYYVDVGKLIVRDSLVVADPPVIIGGLWTLGSYIQYPPIARKAGVSGDVSVRFTVGADGRARDVRIEKGIGAGADQQVERAVSKLEFEPARMRALPIDVDVSLVVSFVMTHRQRPK